MRRHIIRVFVFFGLFLGTLPTSAQRPDDKKPGHSDDLLVGPIKVKAWIRATREEKAVQKEVTLLFLTKTKCIYKEDTGRPKITDGTHVTKLVGDGLKDDWTWDNDAKSYKGPQISPSPIALAAVKPTASQLAGYLATSAEFLHLSLDNALFLRDEKRVARVLEHADRVRDYIAKNHTKEKLADPLKNLYDLGSHAKKQQALQTDMAAENKALQQKAADTARALAVAKRRYEDRANYAMLAGILGVGAVTLSDDPNVQDAGKGLAVAAAKDLWLTAASRRVEELDYLDRREMYTADAVKKITDLSNTYQKNRSELATRFKPVWIALGVDPAQLKDIDTLATGLLSKQDFSAAVEVFDTRLRYSTTKGVASPRLLVNVNSLKAGLLAGKALNAADRAKRSDDIYKLALTTLEATRLIPDDPVFDVDRVFVLTAVGKMIHSAVTYGYGVSNWAECYDPRADFGVRVLDAALSYGLLLDADGSARTTRAALLFQRGLHKEALEQMLQVEKLRETDAESMVNLARFHVHNEPTRAQAVDAFEKALKAGYRDLRAVDADQDLSAMRAVKHDLWKHRDTPDKFDAFLAPNPPGKGDKFTSYNLEIKNKTRYPMVNVKVKFIGYLPAPVGKLPQLETSKEITIDYLGPAGTPFESFVWADAFQTNNKYTRQELSVVLADVKNPKTGKPPLVGSVPVKAAGINIYRPYFWYY